MFPIWKEKFIHMLEFARGLYRYPDRLLGRHCTPEQLADQTDILVFAAHPDDDILGLGTVLYRHSLTGSRITVVFTTNGSSYSYKKSFAWAEAVARIRYEEAAQALSLIGLTKQNVICLGYPDRGTHRYLKGLAEDIERVVDALKPQKIYVHAIEGGHPDHDITSFIVQSVCRLLRFYKVYEWTEYNQYHDLGSPHITFLPEKIIYKHKIEMIRISEHERILKGKMLACHKSQDVVGYFNHGEAVRQTSLTHLESALKTHWLLPKELLRPVLKSSRQLLMNADKRRRSEAGDKATARA
ncbi:PIG-L deacetylase family protein [Paenibacillus piri]|uniref:PIG-L family deacetylase n=1 Tax=Paenibacillus piri TaxID=2547395 RepID=A0A4V2ZUB0_9BACL|nr:PIG-L family deacetylase [Paenibacillus piri]TDG00315.1 PIG-L family deacetylase [Paenibacillus piri]